MRKKNEICCPLNEMKPIAAALLKDYTGWKKFEVVLCNAEDGGKPTPIRFEYDAPEITTTCLVSEYPIGFAMKNIVIGHGLRLANVASSLSGVVADLVSQQLPPVSVEVFDMSGKNLLGRINFDATTKQNSFSDNLENGGFDFNICCESLLMMVFGLSYLDDWHIKDDNLIFISFDAEFTPVARRKVDTAITNSL